MSSHWIGAGARDDVCLANPVTLYISAGFRKLSINVLLYCFFSALTRSVEVPPCFFDEVGKVRDRSPHGDVIAVLIFALLCSRSFGEGGSWCVPVYAIAVCTSFVKRSAIISRSCLQSPCSGTVRKLLWGRWKNRSFSCAAVILKRVSGAWSVTSVDDVSWSDPVWRCCSIVVPMLGRFDRTRSRVLPLL